MKRALLLTIPLALWAAARLASSSPPAWPTLAQQLAADRVIPGSALEALIRANQDFSMLRPEEAGDLLGIPPWLRVYWRREHPEGVYAADDPTGGYPRVLLEMREWMRTHQDLKRGAPRRTSEPAAVDPDAVTGVVNVSGQQTSPRSESDIRVNPLDATRVVAASNAITSAGAQAQFWSTDGGASWGRTSLPFTGSDQYHSDPAVDWTSDGAAWSLTLGIKGGQLAVRAYRSTDGGATWAFDGTPSGSQHGTDKELMWVDHSSTSPFRDTVYAIWHNGNPAFVSRRTAGAWQTPVQVSGAETSGTAIGGDITTNGDGHVFAGWPATSNRRILVARSTDGGATFAPASIVTTTFDGYDIGVPSFDTRRALIYVSLAARKSNGKSIVHASWTDLAGGTGCNQASNEPGSSVSSPCRTRVWYTRSTDGGATWEAPRKVNDQPSLNDQFNQRLCLDPASGTVGLMYYDTVNDPGRLKTDVFFQASTDDGATWSGAQKVTTGQTDETVSGADGGNQYGDYNGLSGLSSRFLPSWTDRSLGGREQIWAAAVTATAPVKGDVDGNRAVNVTDALYLVNYLFAGGPAPLGPADANGDGKLNVSDVLYLVNYLFANGPAPL